MATVGESSPCEYSLVIAESNHHRTSVIRRLIALA